MKDVYWQRRPELEPTLLHAIIQTVPNALHDIVIEEVKGKVEVPARKMGRTQGRWLYHKLANLLEIIDGLPDGVAPEAMLAAVDAFAEDRWMKVAGGAKVSLLDAAYNGHAMAEHEVSLEFGTFIGYTAIRLGADKLLVTIEVDVIHCAVARRILKKARVAAEVWVGTVRDLLPRILDEFGENSAGFVFCDQRGTSFQEDLARLERLRIVNMGRVVADNVLRPGAPVFLWAALHGALDHLKIWSLPEQGQEADDWVVVGDHPCFLHCKALQSVSPTLHRLAWESDVMRGLAEEGGILGADWAGFTDHVLHEYALLGFEAEPWPLPEEEPNDQFDWIRTYARSKVSK